MKSNITSKAFIGGLNVNEHNGFIYIHINRIDSKYGSEISILILTRHFS